MAKRLCIIWVKSSIGYSQQQKDTIKTLGLKRLGDRVEREDSPSLRGMVQKVSHLVRVEEIEAER